MLFELRNFLGISVKVSVIPSLGVDGRFSKSELLIKRSGGPGLGHATVPNSLETWSLVQKSENTGNFKLPSPISDNPDVGGQGQWKSGQLCLVLFRVFFLKAGQHRDRKVQTNRHRTAFCTKLPDRIGQRTESRQTESGYKDNGQESQAESRQQTDTRHDFPGQKRDKDRTRTVLSADV